MPKQKNIVRRDIEKISIWAVDGIERLCQLVMTIHSELKIISILEKTGEMLIKALNFFYIFQSALEKQIFCLLIPYFNLCRC